MTTTEQAEIQASPDEATPAANLLSKTDVSALRKAEKICFSLSPDCTTIRCLRKQSQRIEGWQEVVEEQYLINCNGDVDTRTGWSQSGCRPDFTRAYHQVAFAQGDLLWRTVVEFLRTGDRIALLWRPDASTNGYVQDAKLHADDFCVEVWRKNRLVGRFLLDVCVTAKGSTARPVS
jgi:hypothetical protein